MRLRWLLFIFALSGCTLLVDSATEEGGGSGATGGAAGTPSTGGVAGTATGTQAGSDCVATGSETCSNGVDDDCNGVQDCADPACGGSCEEAPAGAVVLKEVAGPGACPEGWVEHAYTSCSECSCVAQTPGTCVFAVSVYSSPDCLGAPLATATTSAAACVPLTPAATTNGKLGAEAVTVGAADGVCAPATATSPAVTRTFCEPPSSAGGCGPLTCMPALAGPTCVVLPDASECPAAYPVRERLNDATAANCTCSCVSTDQTCPDGKHVHAHPDGACDESKENIDAGKGCDNTKLSTIGSLEQHDEPLLATATSCASSASAPGASSQTLCCSD